MKPAKLLLASLLTVLVPSSALAASPADERQADTLFRAAQKLLNEGKTHEACEKFAQSQALDPAVGTLLNLAKCHATEGRTATARDEFTEAARLAAARGPEDHDRAEYARKQAAELDAKVATVKLDLAAGATSVELDGRALAKGAWDRPIAVDPGPHEFVVVGPGKAPRRASITTPPGPGAQSLAVPRASSTAASIGPDSAIDPAAGPPDPASDDPHRGRRIGGFVVVGVGLAGAAVGAIFGVRAIGKKDSAKAHCAGAFCDETGLDLDAQAHSSATISTIAIGAGLAAIGAGTVLILISPHQPKAAAGRVHLAPLIGASSGGLRVEGTW